MSERTIFCKKCILHDGFLGLKINREGFCNFCANPNHKNVNWSKVLINSDLKKEFLSEWNSIVKAMKKFRGKQKYDCAIGYSGGKDSTALLDLVINDYKLTPLAITVNTGFMTDIANENIKDTLEKINVEHIFINDAVKTFEKLYQYLFLNHNSNVKCLTKEVCDFCSDLLHSIVVNEALKRKIGHILFGYSPDQIARYFFEIPKNEILFAWKPDFISNAPFNEKDREWYINPNEEVSKEIPRVILPYHVLNYQENLIIETIENKKLIKKGNADPIKTNCNVVGATLFYDINRYGGIPYALQYAELTRQDPSIRKKWLRTIKMMAPLIRDAKFKEKGVKEFLDKISISKEDLIKEIQVKLNKDPNKNNILKYLNSIKNKKT